MTELPSHTARDPPLPTVERHAKTLDVDIKNGKVIFRQRPMSFEKMTETMQEMVNFREWLESRTQRREPPLTQIPESYWPLVAKFTQESDKTITALSKHIQQELAPHNDEIFESLTSVLPLSPIEDVVKLLAARVNYGIESPLTKTPAALCVWRWELKQEYLGYLPKVSREKVDARLADRIQYKKDLQAMFDSEHVSSFSNEVVIDASDDQLFEKAVNPDGDDNQTTVRKPDHPRVSVDPVRAVEKAAKLKERGEKKAAKAEKERKVKESQEKARSMMASFFGKQKASSASTSPSKGPDSSLPEFDRVFRPFMLKKDAELAPINWFQDAKRRKTNVEAHVIVIDADDDDDDDDVEMRSPEPDPNVSTREQLRRALSGCPSLPISCCSSDTVRSIMTRLSEAEVSDDTTTVRSLLSELQDRSRIPAKYDSGEEWGEEEEGGGDDVLGDSDDEREDEEESDDLDGWLVDGDDDEDSSKSKRKAVKEKGKETDGEAKAKKRKVVVPLVPFVKGPCLEAEIGVCPYEPFNQYRIQLFNDAPYPLNPFTFVSTPVDARDGPGPTTASTSGANPQSQFVMPALPPHIVSSNTPTSGAASVNGQPSQAKRPRTTPKNPFPDVHLPFLKEKVASMATNSLIALVEALHLDLKTHRVKKNAIEAKIREICVKDQRHVWSLKTDTESPSLEVPAPP
ncbi:hypothetical protein F5148DRAFT_1375796 [Russula earlei]|uniref:Uncharacterized protein n=1 Tax=Russula earlei TaxID=71964 RepID=A0ACC0UAH8_9AGAM|nr:hypothetical protein F5148DRAFT_1375796 [Russula earlei]